MSTQISRILSVEIRAARLGYAVFESAKQLGDFGAASFAAPGAARRRIARLLRLYRPTLLLLHGAGSRYPRDMRVRKSVARIVKDEARKASVPTALVPDRRFKSFFDQFHCLDKYDIAAIIALRFPELTWRVPPPLDFYDPEPPQMLYFDSIALAIVYLESLGQVQTDPADDGIFSPASK